MKKIPTLFVRTFENHKVVGITDQITDGCENAFLHGDATVKIDGSCCAIIGGEFYKRYDAKKGKQPPVGAIPCCDPDPITGHHPHWVKVEDAPENKWFVNAYNNTPDRKDGTYEAIGLHFQGNPYGFGDDILEPHGVKVVDVPRTFDGVKNFLATFNIEGLVFWLNGEPVCKIKRTDFGFEWPTRKGESDG